jgi:hypothetical protein
MRADRRRKDLQTAPSLTGLDAVTSHVERELVVRDWRLVARENLGAFAQ